MIFELGSFFYSYHCFMKQAISCNWCHVKSRFLLTIEIDGVWGQNSRSIHISLSLLFPISGVLSCNSVLFFPTLIQVGMEAFSTKAFCYLSCWNWVMLEYI